MSSLSSRIGDKILIPTAPISVVDIPWEQIKPDLLEEFELLLATSDQEEDKSGISLVRDFPHLKYLLLTTFQHHQDYDPYPPPYSETEIGHFYSALDIRNLVDLIAYLDNPYYFMILSGMRETEGSLFSWDHIPPNFVVLSEVASSPYNQYLSQVARAVAKHSYRCQVDYWPEVKGNPAEQNTSAMDLVGTMLNSFTWWNMYLHSKHGKILEFRDKTGHGMRWVLDPNHFLGLVEPVDPHRGRIFWESYDEFRDQGVDIGSATTSGT